MPRVARSTSIDPRTPQIVHVWNRCVRRAFLCGTDVVSGKNYRTSKTMGTRPIGALGQVLCCGRNYVCDYVKS